jgi:hypothetical protein
LTRAPAAGERWALRGYRWQYDHIAALVYDAVIEDDFESLRLTDPEAASVDDLVLLRRGRVDGFQFKSAEVTGYVTLAQVARAHRSRSGKPGSSLLRSLAEGWLALRSRWPHVEVHLVTQQQASPHDHLTEQQTSNRPSPDHTHAFVSRVLEPLRAGSLDLDDVTPEWGEPLNRVRAATSLPADEFEEFLRALHLDLGASPPLPEAASTRRSDIIDLSNALFRAVSAATSVVSLNQQQLLDLMRWSERPRLRSHHDFPVDLDTYAPLEAALAELDAKLARRDYGYIAVLGPPGAGKSTLLAQALSGRSDHIVRYYAYIPGYAPARGRMTARGFLHDLVLMFSRAGLCSGERHLLSEDRDQLRLELHAQLDSAGEEFRRTGRRTIVVIDGFDHVEREHPGQDGLLVELPAPSELPDGVVVVIGSRTQTPLGPQARQQIEEHATALDLEHHRLLPADVLRICRRAPMTAGLGVEVHQRVAELSAGHPLALTYLLNRLRDREDDEDPNEVLDAAPAYSGDIAAEYRAVWDRIEADVELIAIVGVCARLRVGFTTDWLGTWAPAVAVATFRRELRYLFRGYHDGLRFFHDSFRQFAVHRTALGDDGRYSAARDAAEHARVADLCAMATEKRLAFEELYHRHRAGQPDAVLALATQARFREQFRAFRSAGAIREDIALALYAVGDREDATHLLATLLAGIELAERAAVLERIDLPGALLDAGLVDEALAVCGGDVDRQIPLGHAYRLAARLGRAGRPEGRRIFDLIEHNGFEDPDRGLVAGEEDDAAAAWGDAAPLFRPLSKIIPVARVLLGSGGDEAAAWERGRAPGRFAAVIDAVTNTLAEQRRTDDLKTIDQALADIAASIRGAALAEEAGQAGWRGDMATVTDLRFQIRSYFMDLAGGTPETEQHLDSIEALFIDTPAYQSTLLDAAELFTSFGCDSVAAMLVQRLPDHPALTASSLSYGGERGAVDNAFRYWCLRHLLADITGAPAELTPLAETTSAGDDVSPSAARHRDTDAIELAARIDRAVRVLARLDAALLSESPPTAADAWSEMVPVLDVFRPAGPHSSATLGGIRQQKAPLMRVIASVAARFGAGLPQRLADALAARFADQPGVWPTKLRLDLARQLREAGASVTWYDDVLVAAEREAREGDVTTRLEDITALVSVHADEGRADQARKLALELVPMAFGIGYRKDHQLSDWTDWLGRALRERGNPALAEEAAWLARVLVATEPMTEGAPRSAAERLPAAVASASPLAAVRIFEYLVRSGTVDHVAAMAALVADLVDLVPDSDPAPVDLAADLAAELLAPAADTAYPDAARSVVAAARRTKVATAANGVPRSMVERTDRYALPTTRRAWREGMGLPTDAAAEDPRAASDDDYAALVLRDGRRIAPADVRGQVLDAAAVAALRRDESAEQSTFDWSSLVASLTLSEDEVRLLAATFDDDSQRTAEVLVVLAKRLILLGNIDDARQLATRALAAAPDDSWSWVRGATRRRAFAVAIATGVTDARGMACRNLAEQILTSRWFAGTLAPDLAQIVEALDPGTPSARTWPAVRAHLDGIAETLTLPTEEVLNVRPIRWWVPQSHSLQRDAASDDSPSAALAELAVAHLAHPTWVARDAATRIVIRALTAPNAAVAEALARLGTETADDVLEAAGRCLAAARCAEGYVPPACLTPLEQALATHPSQVIRDLASTIVVTQRPLSPVYKLTMPPSPSSTLVGHERPFLMPHEQQYEILANGLDLDEHTLRAVAARYAHELRDALPTPTDVRNALDAARMRHTYPTPQIVAARGAFGRVVADLADAGFLEDIPPHITRLLRTVDVDLLALSPRPRPAAVPSPPPAGHDQTATRWLASTDQRLTEYHSSASAAGQWLVGARSRMTVLNWNHLEEELVCGTVLGSGIDADAESLFRDTSSARLSDRGAATPVRLRAGEPLVISNLGWTFHQLNADWLAFRPDVALALGWKADTTTPGRWLTEDGDLAVETVWWVDGWPGRAGPAVDDTEADGNAVTLTQAGLSDLIAKLGPVTRKMVLTRWGRDDGQPTERVQATRRDTTPPLS